MLWCPSATTYLYLKIVQRLKKNLEIKSSLHIQNLREKELNYDTYKFKS
jgi:hypothetical protein